MPMHFELVWDGGCFGNRETVIPTRTTSRRDQRSRRTALVERGTHVC